MRNMQLEHARGSKVLPRVRQCPSTERLGAACVGGQSFSWRLGILSSTSLAKEVHFYEETLATADCEFNVDRHCRARPGRRSSKIVHGQWKADADSTEKMAEVERLVRQSLTEILENADLKKMFSEKGRERFLDDLVFKNGAA